MLLFVVVVVQVGDYSLEGHSRESSFEERKGYFDLLGEGRGTSRVSLLVRMDWLPNGSSKGSSLILMDEVVFIKANIGMQE